MKLHLKISSSAIRCGCAHRGNETTNVKQTTGCLAGNAVGRLFVVMCVVSLTLMSICNYNFDKRSHFRLPRANNRVHRITLYSEWHLRRIYVAATFDMHSSNVRRTLNSNILNSILIIRPSSLTWLAVASTLARAHWCGHSANFALYSLSQSRPISVSIRRSAKMTK